VWPAHGDHRFGLKGHHGPQCCPSQEVLEWRLLCQASGPRALGGIRIALGAQLKRVYRPPLGRAVQSTGFLASAAAGLLLGLLATGWLDLSDQATPATAVWLALFLQCLLGLSVTRFQRYGLRVG